MDYKEEIHFKALSYLYLKESVDVVEYRKYLKELFGARWEQAYEELDKSGFIHLKTKRVKDYPVLKEVEIPIGYSITEQGNIFYKAMEVKMKDEGKLKKYNKWILLFTAIGALAAIIVIYEFLKSIFCTYWPDRCHI